MNKSACMSVRLDPPTRQRLVMMAKLTGRSKGGVIRALIHSAEIPTAPGFQVGSGWADTAGDLAGQGVKCE